jgi:hypothetical protein
LKLAPKLELEKFSNLDETGEELRSIEATNLSKEQLGSRALEKARAEVLSAIEGVHWTRYSLGKALEAYRTYYKADRGWMEAAAVIARSLRCDSRTVRNIIRDYHGVKMLPENVIEAAHSRRIDLARKKYSPLTKLIHAEIDSAPQLSDEAAGRIIDKVIQMPKQKSSDDDPFATLTQDEKARWNVRMKIRTALNNIDTPRELTELVAALEEEMFAVWGQTEPITVTITPRPSSLTLDGRKRKN